MAQLPAVSNTLRASLTSRRSRTYLSPFTRSRTRRQGPDRHSPYRQHTHHTAQLSAVSDTKSITFVTKIATILVASYSPCTHRQDLDRHSPHRDHTRGMVQLPAVSDAESYATGTKIGNIHVESYSPCTRCLGPHPHSLH
jgi:hypothetical protein